MQIIYLVIPIKGTDHITVFVLYNDPMFNFSEETTYITRPKTTEESVTFKSYFTFSQNETHLRMKFRSPSLKLTKEVSSWGKSINHIMHGIF